MVLVRSGSSLCIHGHHGMDDIPLHPSSTKRGNNIFRDSLPQLLQIEIKPLYLHSQFSDGTIAQLVEQRTENPCVPGSIPGGTTEMRELRK